MPIIDVGMDAQGNVKRSATKTGDGGGFHVFVELWEMGYGSLPPPPSLAATNKSIVDSAI